MRRGGSCLALACVALGLWTASPSRSTTITVPGDFLTIQAAIDFASDADSILVGPGTYHETLLIEGKTLYLRSGSGAASTIIDGGAPTRPDTLSVICVVGSPDLLIEGFTIKNGRGGTSTDVSPPNSGGGICAIGAEGTIRECVITDNECDGRGGGVLLFATSMIIEGCVIRGNRALLGGGLSLNVGGPQVRDSDIIDNRAVWGSGVHATNSNPLFERLLVAGNQNDTAFYGCGGGIIVDAALAQIRSCTIVGNKNVCAGGVSFDSALSPSTISNCIVAQNVGDGVTCNQSNPTLTCNDFFGNTSDALCGTDGGNNLNVDPVFCSNEWTLSDSSPCAAAHSPSGCGLIGARGVACPSAVEPATWGRIKAQRWR